MVQIFKCRILENSRVGQNYFRMIFAAPQIARESRAGQFVHLRCTTSIDPLLRRPFSIHRMDRDKVEILYRVIGRGTAEIAKRKAGEIVDVMGPLGQGFEIPKGGEHSRAILIAGGIGVAPMVMLAEEIKKVRESKCLQCSDVTSEITESFGQRVRVLIGAKTKKELLCEKEFKKSGCEVKVATQDGSKGFKGLVTELLEQSLTTHNAPPARLADCQSLARGSPRRSTVFPVYQHLPCIHNSGR